MQNGYVPKDLNLRWVGQALPAIQGRPPHDARFVGAWTREGRTLLPQILSHTGLQWTPDNLGSN